MARGRIRVASSQQALGAVKYIRLSLIFFVVVIGLMVAGLWIFKPRILQFSFGQPVRITVHYVDTAYKLDGKEADSDKKYLLVAIRLTCRGRAAHSIRPDHFEIETSNGGKYRAHPKSPLFQDRGPTFTMAQGDEIEGQLAFEVPQDIEGTRLFFPAR